MPKIVQLKPRRKNTWVEIAATNVESIKLPVGEVPAGLGAGDMVEQAEWDRLHDRAEYCRAMDVSVRLLARREHFPAELRKKLIQRGIGRQHIAAAMAECQERGYIDERRAAEQLMDTLSGRGGIGRARYRSALMQRGCPRDLCDEVIAKRLDGMDEAEEVAQLLSSRSKSLTAKLHSLIERDAGGTLKDPALRRKVSQKFGSTVLRFVNARGFMSSESRQAAAKFVGELLAEY